MSAQPETLWRIHPMRESHLPWIMPIEQSVYQFPWTEAIFNDCLRVGYSSWVVTNTIGEVLAYGLLSMAVGEAHLLNLCVDSAHQRKGLARHLLQHLIRVASHAQIEVIFLEVRKSNSAARKLYRSFDFQQVGVRPGYYPAADGREDALVLELRLPEAR